MVFRASSASTSSCSTSSSMRVGNLVVVGGLLDALLDRLRHGDSGPPSVAVVPTARNESQNMPPPYCEAVAVLSASKLASKIDHAVVVAAVDHDANALALHPRGLVHEALAIGVHEHGRGRGTWRQPADASSWATGRPGTRRRPMPAMLWPSPTLPLVGAQAGHDLRSQWGRTRRGTRRCSSRRPWRARRPSSALYCTYFAVLVLADGACDLAGVVLHELHGRHLVHELGVAVSASAFAHEQVLNVGRRWRCLVLRRGLAAGDHVVAIDLGVHGRCASPR